MKEKENLMKEKQTLEKENKSLKTNIMKSTIQMNSGINNKDIKKSNIMESQIFMDDDNFNAAQNNKKNNINKSMSPFSGLPGMSLKGSIMPFGDFGQIKEENEDSESKKGSSNKEVDNKGSTNKESWNNNLKNSEMEFGGAYMDDDDDGLDDFEEEPKIEEKKDQKKGFKKSSILGMSLNNNLFEFNNQYDENYVGELKMEINDLYKKRDKMEDDLNDKDEKLKQSMLNIEELNRIIERKNKEIEELKKK